MNKKSIISLVLEAILLIGVLMFVMDRYESKLDVYEQNLKASHSEIETLQLKNGEMLTMKDSYILKTNELEEALGISKKEVNELKNKLGSSLSYISQLESSIRIDSIEIRDSVFIEDDGEEVVKFEYIDDWIELFGVHRERGNYHTTTINSLRIDVPLQVGLDNQYKIWVKSMNPYVEFTDVEGAVIDGSVLRKKDKKLTWGMQMGFGVTYDVIDKDVAIGPYGGLGVNIRF